MVGEIFQLLYWTLGIKLSMLENLFGRPGLGIVSTEVRGRTFILFNRLLIDMVTWGTGGESMVFIAGTGFHWRDLSSWYYLYTFTFWIQILRIASYNASRSCT